jgi:predicted phage tail protein
MQVRTIKVYGKLRKFLGKSTFKAAVNSPLQAYNFLKANFANVEKHMNDQIYKIKMGDRVIHQEFLNMKGTGDIHIIPVASGAKKAVKWVTNKVKNVVSDAIDFVADNALSLGLAFATGGWSYVAQTAALSLASDLLAPQQPSISASSVGDLDPSIRGSYSFSGVQNVANSGVPIPIIYGLVYSGSIIVSAGTDTAQIVKKIS